MATSDKNNHIAIAKAIGIILMVIGHAGTPSIYIGKFIYLFHMPLFFFCSGYFFKGLMDIDELIPYCKKRLLGLYLPYLKYSLLFLLLHNIFFQFYLYEYPYDYIDFLRQFLKTLVMSDYETMLRPFWFIKVFFLSSIFAAIVSLFYRKNSKYINTKTITILCIILTIMIKTTNNPIPVIGDLSVITFGITYIYSGHLFRQYEGCIHINHLMLIIIFLATAIGCVCFIGIIDMRYTTISNTIPYYLLSILGIIMVIRISQGFNRHLPSTIKNALYYIGNHTMSILALHLFAFKLGNLAKIWFYDMPIEKLSDHTIIYENNNFFWIIYIVLGISLPIFINYIYNAWTTKLEQNRSSR